MPVDDNFRALAEEVREAGGLLACRMERLRDDYDAGRLGTHVVSGISDKLAEFGIGHNYEGDELPTSQHDDVRLYIRGTEVGNIIEAVLSPNADRDRFLLEVASTDARQVLQRIRELVCD